MLKLTPSQIYKARAKLDPHVDAAIVNDTAALMGLRKIAVKGQTADERLDFLLSYFNVRGRVDKLFATLAEINPSAQDAINEIITDAVTPDRIENGLGSIPFGVITPGTQKLLFDDGRLQRLVRDKPQSIDHVALLLRIIGAGQRICRIERATSLDAETTTPLGTGFLVGSNLVLTNFHVVKQVKVHARFPPSELRCRFDFLRDANGTVVAQGKTVSLNIDKWLVDYSDFAPGDDQPGQREATADELDYALLLLLEEPGKDDAEIPATGVKCTRGWYDLDHFPTSPAAGEELIVVGHADGKPLVHSIGKTLGYAAEFRRLRHDAYTLPGSSGSPVFNGDYHLVGLHQAGDPELSVQAKFNQAVPLSLIAARSRSKRNGG